jgi:uncharacterized repeat protein (TIGR03806 family)
MVSGGFLLCSFVALSENFEFVLFGMKSSERKRMSCWNRRVWLVVCGLLLWTGSLLLTACPGGVDEPGVEPSLEPGREIVREIGETTQDDRDAAVDRREGPDGGPDGGADTSPDIPLPDIPRTDRPYGLTQRKANSTCKLDGEPDTVESLQVVQAFPNLTFSQPLYITHAPDGTNRLFVVEKTGRIYVFDNQNNTRTKTLFFDLSRRVFTRSEAGLLGFAFHPNFKVNRLIYVYYSALNSNPRMPHSSFVSSFRVEARNPSKVDMSTETVLMEIEQPYNNHNGGMIAFGKDGYLYISVGDGGSANDPLNHGQNLNSLLGAILRIDVDKKENGKNYAIPKDNPFVGQAGAKPEIWAYGLRNVWRFSFDRLTGDLWAGDVGQKTKEEIDLIVKGGNYGWRTMEGTLCFRPATNCNKKDLILPVFEHGRGDARSITGGYVYRGKKFASLYGSYVYGDYVTGKIWGLRYDGKAVTRQGLLVDSFRKLVSFGEDKDGELYFVDIVQGRIYTFETRGAQASKFPRLLSNTGCFSDLKTMKPAAGVVPYNVISPLWSDSIDKQRWLALPGTSSIKFAVDKPWQFPEGTVIIKHFSWLLTRGDAKSRRKIETRFLVKRNGDWRGYTYLWNDEQTDARLLDNALVRTFVQNDPQDPAKSVTLKHTLPSRADCLSCHTVAAGRVLGVTTRQLNRDFDYGGVKDNQLRSWENIGLFGGALPKRPAALPKLFAMDDNNATVTQKVRSYLDSNCAGCHRPGVQGTASTNLLFGVPLKDTRTCNVVPDKGDLGVANARILTPGKPELSTLFLRMNRRDKEQMPNLGTALVHKEAIDLLRKWILGLQVCP